MKISETFYSIQGEGISTGVPSIFIRLTGCNLICGGPNGSLMKKGAATWWCDSETVWKAGKDYTNEELYNKFKEMGQIENIRDGGTHLIWTGGEPTLVHHKRDIKSFIDYFYSMHPESSMFNEIETNASLPVDKEFYERYIQQINSSPKLKNSGMPSSMRINADTLIMINNHPNGWFKFVVSNEEDINEIFEEFIKPHDLDPSAIILMPGVDCLENLPERTKFVFEMAKKYNVRACTRAHILAWNRATGV